MKMQNNFDTILETLNTVPDDHPFIERKSCPCGGKICNGWGHVIIESGAYTCPAMEEKYLRDHIGIASYFSDWPPKSFMETWNDEEDEITDPFLYSEKMMQDIYHKKTPWAVVFYGKTGRSKTCSALKVCRGCYKIRKQFYAIKFNDIIETYKRGVDGDAKRNLIFDRIQQSDFILIDDIGKQRSGGRDFTTEALWNIVELTIRRKFMIWTTNFKKDEFIDRLISSNEDYVSPLLSRISNKSGWFVEGVYENSERDLRMKNQA